MKFEIPAKLRTITWDQVKKYIRGNIKDLDPQNFNDSMRILSDLIKKYRWELLQTSSGYKVITCGGYFHSVETAWPGETPKRISANTILSRLDGILENPKDY